MMIRKVDDVEKGTNIVCTLGGNQEMWLLTEDGMYEVLMQSKKPKAQKRRNQAIIKTNQVFSFFRKILTSLSRTLDNR